MKKNTWFKYSLVPICLVIMVSCFMLFGENNNSKTFKTDSGNKIVVNNLKDIGTTSLDARLDVDIKMLPPRYLEYNGEDNIVIPTDFNKKAVYQIFTKKDKNTTEYNILHDNVTEYIKEEYQGNDSYLHTKRIIITYSENFIPLRDYYIDTINLKMSKINDIELTIANYNDMYIAIFKYNNLNFDVETQGISEIELINLLESMIK